MHLLELGWGQRQPFHALVLHDLVQCAELLEQPQDALRTRVIEMMDCEHGGPPLGPHRSSRRATAQAIASGIFSPQRGTEATETLPYLCGLRDLCGEKRARYS